MSTETTIKVEADVRSFVAAMQQAQGATNRMQASMAGALGKVKTQVSVTNNSVRTLGERLERFAVIGGGAVTMLQGFYGAIAPIVGVLKDFAVMGFADAMDDEVMAVQLSSFTQSLSVAKELQGELDKLAANGVVALDDLGKAAQALAIEFRGDVPAMMDWVEVFADIAASGKISAEQLSNGWARVRANGFADSRVLNQLQNVGIPIIKALADEMGIAAQEAARLAKERGVDADLYCRALRRMREEEYKGKNAELSNTTMGSWGTLKATFENALGDAAAPFLPGISSAIKSVTNDINDLAEAGWDCAAAFGDEGVGGIALRAMLLDPKAIATGIQADTRALTALIAQGEWINPLLEARYDKINALFPTADMNDLYALEEKVAGVQSKDDAKRLIEEADKMVRGFEKRRDFLRLYHESGGQYSSHAADEEEEMVRMINKFGNLRDALENGRVVTLDDEGWEDESRSLDEVIKRNRECLELEKQKAFEQKKAAELQRMEAVAEEEAHVKRMRGVSLEEQKREMLRRYGTKSDLQKSIAEAMEKVAEAKVYGGDGELASAELERLKRALDEYEDVNRRWGEQRERRRKVYKEHDADGAMQSARLSGNRERVRLLEREVELERIKRSLISSGLSAKQAEQVAAEKMQRQRELGLKEAGDSYRERMRRLGAEVRGDGVALEWMRVADKLNEVYGEQVGLGVDAGEARVRAMRLVGMEALAEEQRNSQVARAAMSSLVGIGGGGSAMFGSGAQLTEAKKQSGILDRMLKRWEKGVKFDGNEFVARLA